MQDLSRDGKFLLRMKFCNYPDIWYYYTKRVGDFMSIDALEALAVTEREIGRIKHRIVRDIPNLRIAATEVLDTINNSVLTPEQRKLLRME